MNFNLIATTMVAIIDEMEISKASPYPRSSMVFMLCFKLCTALDTMGLYLKESPNFLLSFFQILIYCIYLHICHMLI